MKGMLSFMNGVDYQSTWLIAAAPLLPVIFSSIWMRIQSRAGTQGHPTILCSGGDERGEVTEMARQLLKANVPADCIDLDPTARRMIDSTCALAARSVSQPIVFVSQDFHLPRALFLARGYGLDAWGLPAKGKLRGLPPRLREALARLRAIVARVSRRRSRPWRGRWRRGRSGRS